MAHSGEPPPPANFQRPEEAIHSSRPFKSTRTIPPYREPHVSVDRCVCHNITFRELREIAATHKADLAALSARTACATSCALCRPYIQVMLATGRTEFPVLTESECQALIREATRADH
jgi:bacterioferritin-associated ferredoxin